MALLNRPLTEEEARKMAADCRVGYPKLRTLWDMLQEALANPTPHVVRYRATHPVHHVYTPPNEFHWSNVPANPSDCEWHIPETEKWKTYK